MGKDVQRVLGTAIIKKITYAFNDTLTNKKKVKFTQKSDTLKLFTPRMKSHLFVPAPHTFIGNLACQHKT